MKNKILSLTAMFVITVITTNAQDIKADYAKVFKAYSEQKVFSAEVEVTSFKTKQQGKGELMGTGYIRKEAKNYYSKFLDDEMIYNNRCALIIDHYEKQITYLEGERPQANEFSMPDIEKIFSSGKDSAVYKGTANGQKQYSFYNKRKDAAIIRTDIYIDEKTYFITEITYQYNVSTEETDYGADRINIKYKNIRFTVESKDVFSEKKYVTYSKGNPQLTTWLKDYKLIVVQD